MKSVQSVWINWNWISKCWNAGEYEIYEGVGGMDGIGRNYGTIAMIPVRMTWRWRIMAATIHSSHWPLRNSKRVEWVHFLRLIFIYTSYKLPLHFNIKFDAIGTFNCLITAPVSIPLRPFPPQFQLPQRTDISEHEFNHCKFESESSTPIAVNQ